MGRIAWVAHPDLPCAATNTHINEPPARALT
ncbi:arginyl-tRNA-protein transferase [Xanthomonas fragariae LMG 25863]|nr:arginyl-tRNA-protein transferase [Xanthomonas fragariae LMG 25863]